MNINDRVKSDELVEWLQLLAKYIEASNLVNTEGILQAADRIQALEARVRELEGEIESAKLDAMTDDEVTESLEANGIDTDALVRRVMAAKALIRSTMSNVHCCPGCGADLATVEQNHRCTGMTVQENRRLTRELAELREPKTDAERNLVEFVEYLDGLMSDCQTISGLALTKPIYDALSELQRLRERLEESEKGWDELRRIAQVGYLNTYISAGAGKPIALHRDQFPCTYTQIDRAKQRAEEGNGDT